MVFAGRTLSQQAEGSKQKTVGQQAQPKADPPLAEAGSKHSALRRELSASEAGSKQ